MRSLDLSERIRLVEEHVLTVFTSARTLATLLNVPGSEVEGFALSARRGEVEIGDVGLDESDIQDAMSGFHGVDPEIEAVRIAYRMIESRKEVILASLRQAAPVPTF